jgi:mRNA-degrading endonuclease RelE of RelBE toxin-antitoxin system
MLDDILDCLESGDLTSLDISKLEGEVNRYRVRKGSIRIQFSLNAHRRAILIDVDFRGNAYR